MDTALAVTVVGLTATLIVITALYAWQTRRLANTAADEAKERTRREEETAARISVALRAEMAEITTSLRELVAESETLPKEAGHLNRFFAKITALPRGRVFDGLLVRLADIPQHAVQPVVGSYDLLAGVIHRGEEFLSRPSKAGDVAGFEMDRLREDMDILLSKFENARVLLEE